MLNLVQAYILNGPQLLWYQIYTSRVIPGGRRREKPRTGNTPFTITCRTGFGQCDVFIRMELRRVFGFTETGSDTSEEGELHTKPYTLGELPNPSVQ